MRSQKNESLARETESNSIEMTNPLHARARELHNAGIRVIPVKSDTSKSPAISGWQKHETTLANIDQWFGGESPLFIAMGAVCGSASNGLEMLEIEGDQLHHLRELQQHLETQNAKEIFQRINNGWVETSPSGGFHWLYFVDWGNTIPESGPAGNTKLAQTSDRHAIAETRGASGQFVVAPSSGQAHETGHPWVLVTGGPETAPTLSQEERENLHAAFRMLDQYRTTQAAQVSPAARPSPVTPNADGSAAPGEDYNNKTHWKDILTPDGWTISHVHGDTTYWIRPGKKPGQGISATTGYSDTGDRLYVFTTSTEFDPEIPYTKFGAHTLLTQGSTSPEAFTRAAKKLKDTGYGVEPHYKSELSDADFLARIETNSQRSQVGNTGDNMPGNIPASPETSPQQPGPSSPEETTQDEAETILALSDDGNADLLIRKYGPHLRYVTDQARWYVWQGNYWQEQHDTKGGTAREYVKRIGRAMPDDKGWAAHKRRTLSAKGTTDTLIQAATDPRITIQKDDLDNHPWELNTPAGILDLRTGELSPPDPAKYHTRLTKHTPDFTAPSELWEQFLWDTFGNHDLITYMQRLIGYSAVGEVKENLLPFAHGTGGNGKSVFLEAITDILGDYATTAPNAFLMASGQGKHTTEIARLSGARMVVCSEVNEHDKFDEAKVKNLTGGDKLTARFLFQNDFTFTPTHQLWLVGNDQPDISSGGNSFWRRVRLIPFTRTFDGPNATPENQAKRIPGLQHILANDDHGPKVLVWIAQGAADYHHHGLETPDIVQAATDTYSAEVDTVARFLDEKAELHPTHTDRIEFSEPTRIIRSAYEIWCTSNGERPISGRKFASELKTHGITIGKDAPRDAMNRYYGGVTLLSRTRRDNDDWTSPADIFGD